MATKRIYLVKDSKESSHWIKIPTWAIVSSEQLTAFEAPPLATMDLQVGGAERNYYDVMATGSHCTLHTSPLNMYFLSRLDRFKYYREGVSLKEGGFVICEVCEV